MPILIAVSPCAKLSIGGENIVEAPNAAPVLMSVRRSNGVVKIFLVIYVPPPVNGMDCRFQNKMGYKSTIRAPYGRSIAHTVSPAEHTSVRRPRRASCKANFETPCCRAIAVFNLPIGWARLATCQEFSHCEAPYVLLS